MITVAILIFTTVISMLFVFLLLSSSKYDRFIEPLDNKLFPLKFVYGAGFKLLETVKFKYTGKIAIKIRRELAVLYEEKHADYYLRCVYAQCVSLAMAIMVAMSILSCLSGADNMLTLFVLGIVLSGVVFYYYLQQSSERLRKLSDKYVSVFPAVVSTMALLVNAGMVLRDAWDIVAKSDSTEMHLQMQRVTEERNQGASEADALSEMARRCATPEISKFVSMVIQGLSKGSSELAFTLKSQSDELWELKQQKLLQAGEKASSKLLIPLLVMFVGILIMIMLPIMGNM